MQIQQKTINNWLMTQMTATWPLTPHQLRSHVQLYPRILIFVSNYTKVHQSTWIQWPFKKEKKNKLKTKGQWPGVWTGDLLHLKRELDQCATLPQYTLYIYIFFCIWIQWSVCKTDHIHITYIIHTYYTLKNAGSKIPLKGSFLTPQVIVNDPGDLVMNWTQIMV